ncbi:uncharacterized protein FA14DRAFT_192181 [Meira miltonrushii]|uniref:BZIP domain-containing protein n=1 Tax=Meira miltonrushii TaxID=1280837 RepID=A0A316V8V4_9BASI|nr:uncharacterized protein FA14DRAFT_192181 [Meira miltonrushii]PWN31895.1 hypothetical protein FA14DRAFT_192181 [Meira miltonrushii]
MGRKRTSNEISEERRLQNRLSQQRWREKRKREDDKDSAKSSERGSHQIISNPSQSPQTSTHNHTSETTQTPSSHPSSIFSPYEQTQGLGEVNAKDVIDALALPENDRESDDQWQVTSVRDIDPQHLSESQLLSLAYCSPSLSQTFSLQSMHFAKALIKNTFRFGFDLKFMSKRSSRSYIAQDWLAYKDKQTSSNRRQASDFGNKESDQSTDSSSDTHSRPLQWDKIPNNMRPTEDQLTIQHHPYVDVTFPWPSVRSKLLKMLYTVIDYDDFCDAVFKAGLPGAKVTEPAFYIWGDDPMDQSAWEVGESFAKKYWFLLDDAILARTNWWRRLRGLEQLPNGKG